MKTLTDMLHLLLCKKSHIYDMMKITERESNYCYYYLENDISGGDDMEDHLEWLSIVRNFKSALNLTSDEQALEFIKKVIEISRSIQELSNGDDAKIHFIMSIIT